MSKYLAGLVGNIQLLVPDIFRYPEGPLYREAILDVFYNMSPSVTTISSVHAEAWGSSGDV